MKNISIYLSIIASLLFIGSFIIATIIMFIGRTVRRYKQMVLIYTIGLVFGTLGHIFRFIYSPLPLVNTILLIVFDLFAILFVIQLWKSYQNYEHTEDKHQEWVLVKEWVLARPGASKPEFIIDKNWVTTDLTEARVFTSAPDAIWFRTDNGVSDSYHPVPKELFTK